MSQAAIRVENVSKRYQLGAVGERVMDRTLRETLTDAVGVPLRRLRRPASAPADTGAFWALKEVSFDVQPGEVIGLIGGNGAGKSTLLKILSRITEPTQGKVALRGRVASLLEVGTGFHPELSGRENIFLNAAILGMSRREILRRFDDIVAFAEVEKFIDTPVKRYSSGMYLRLAFAVAAHLAPEILLVDEVLAVGDAQFQKKCLGKMDEVGRSGRTVFLVSHNMSAIQRLCSSAILLARGQMSAWGPAAEVTRRYLEERMTSTLQWERSLPTEGSACFQRIYFSDDTGEALDHVTTATPLHIIIEYTVRERCRNLHVSVVVRDSHGDDLFMTLPQDVGLQPPEEPGTYRAVVSLPPGILLPQPYELRVGLWVPNVAMIDLVENFRFSVQDAASYYSGSLGARRGQLVIRCDWAITQDR